jgi:outer membrane protein OmpA-like peptidoglycan-associated protein
LTKEAQRELDKVVELMTRYPDMIIESGSHTDSRGIDGYNIWLSDRRAKSTVNYIISKGIDPTRITGKGYGETQLINECSDSVSCTEAQHAMNRRTEFVIIKM